MVGNSVHALGFGRAIGSGARGIIGGEITQLTSLLTEGRQAAITRLEGEVKQVNGVGVSGVTTEIISNGDRIEFLSIGSVLHSTQSTQSFSSSSDGQELYCQIDAGYSPLRFVFGNIAYSIGLARGIMGWFRQWRRGEVPQFTEIFTTTRNAALERLVAEAKEAGANSIVNIRTQIMPIAGAGYGMQEMIMIGTASYNADLPAEYKNIPVTSDLLNQELWSMTKKGYAPLKLLMGTSVYSLGFIGGVTSFFKSFRQGEIPELTKLVYEAREKSISKIKAEAATIGADDVVGTKIYLYDLGGGLIEVLAIGTAMKKNSSVHTHSNSLFSQAIINDKDTFTDTTYGGVTTLSRQSGKSGRGMIGGFVTLVIFIVYLVFIIWIGSSGHH